MTVSPELFARAAADPTRLRILVLLTAHPELCVCELTASLDLPQPKISRHLAVLRESGVLRDRRRGQWIHYRLHPDLPAWARDALLAFCRGCAGAEPFETDRRLMGGLAADRTGTCG
jgi:ArsR family transcriptional regulator